MWRNYLTVGLRALLKNKTYAFINVFGLAVGLSACLLLILYVRYETGYDRWLPNAENVYQLQSHARDPATGDDYKMQMSQYVAGTALLQSFPDVEARAYVTGTGPIVLRGGEALSVEDALGTDGPLFDVLDLPLVRGDRRTALARPQDVVLSESEARRLFGAEDPLGETLTLVQRGQHVDHRVTAVIRDLPRSSHLRANMIIRYDPAVWFAEFPEFMTSWGETSGWNYVRLRPGADVARIHAAMPAWERRNVPPREGTREPGGTNEDWRLVNVRDVHLGEAQLASMSPGNDRRTILTFSVVAFLILFMAVVNFTNLATARASQRAREVALRKVLGAGRRQLVIQFLSESLLLAAVAMLLALTASELLLSPLGSFLGADLEMRYFGDGGLFVPILGLLLLVGAVGGLYPAFYLSRFQPAQVLKANKSASEAAGTGRIRSILVVAQFAVSIGLIICTAVVWSQTVHARSADPGFRREGVIQIENIGRRQVAAQAESLKRELERVEGVRFASRTAIGISTGSTMGRDVWLPGADAAVNIGNYAVDEDFFAAMGIDRIAGRTFDPNRPMDRLDVPTDTNDAEGAHALVARGGNVVVNELAARRLGFRNPADAVGRQVRVQLFPFSPEFGLVPVTIVGVVKDTRWRSIRLPVEPIMYRLGSDYASYMAVRYESAEPNAVRERIAAVWRRLFPDVPFEGEFSEDIVAELYNEEAARAQVFAGFAMLAIVVACLGLFGLAAFTAERRTKEIGIRKVLGARSRDIVKLLAWQFSKPVIVANLVAWPVAWWAMRDWLNDFDTRIDLGPAPFLLAGLVALAIAIGTIAGHAIKVARANPIHALRYE
jgi:putative ABC transport system permease protein